MIIKTLTKDEITALRAAFESARGNSHDFGFVEDIVRALRPLKAQAVGALVTSLSKKGVLTVHAPVRTESGLFTQFTWDLELASIGLLVQQPSTKTDRAATRRPIERKATMTTKTNRKTSKARKTNDVKADGRSTPDGKIVLVKGATAKRGLMAKMVKLVGAARGGMQRSALAKACRGQPRSRVMKNVAWGIRHGVFGVNLAA